MESPKTFEFFRPYRGTKPFLFISYAHRNSALVLPVITKLRYAQLSESETPEKAQRFLIWYDEGIAAGEDWASSIAKHMRSCNTVLFFPSKDSFRSGNCLTEIRTAKKLNKKIYCMPLDDTDPPAYADDGKESWNDLMKSCSFLPMSNTAEERFSSFLRTGKQTEHLIGTEADYSENGSKTGFNRWIIGILLAGLLLFASLFSILGLYFGIWKIPGTESEQPVSSTPQPTPESTPEPAGKVVPGTDILRIPVNFSQNGQQEAIIRKELGSKTDTVYEEDLYGIEELHIIANKDSAVKDPETVEITEDGRCLMNNVEFSVKGKISDLSVFGKMANLQKLSLIKQPLTSLSSISSDMNRLTELNLACSDLNDLSGIHHAPNLMALHLEHTAVRDLSPLKELKQLKTVYVTKDMLPLPLDADAAYDVILVK